MLEVRALRRLDEVINCSHIHDDMLEGPAWLESKAKEKIGGTEIS